ncbi:K+ Transporter [Blattamonas nauphoetae]|uniref:K+ Transporter n=1 Tax=Blattamonas nauphoetae TaxID=2049346 RepID=A0ABQ9XA91_9EUKA|nr:K+ Transporter [Blattamonas nauphoetae]
MEVDQKPQPSGDFRRNPLIPSEICLAIARGLRHIQKLDRHHVFFGRLSSHSVLFDQDDMVSLHLKGASEVQVSAHDESMNTPNYVFDEIADSKHLFSPGDEAMGTGTGRTSTTGRETLEQRLLAEQHDSSSSSQKEWIEKTISTTTDSSRSRTVSSTASVLTSATRARPHLETRTVIDGGIDHIRWRAPELSSGADVSIQTAIFSLGMILWEVHTREIPFAEASAEEACIRLCAGERPSLATIADSTQAMLIERCWAHDPRRRPSIDEVIQILQEIEDVRLAGTLMEDFSMEAQHEDVFSTESMEDKYPNYIDAVFMTMSAISGTGFLTFDMSKISLASQIFFLITIQAGSSVMLSAAPLIIRRYQIRRTLKKHHRRIWVASSDGRGYIDRIFYDGDIRHPRGIRVPYLDPDGTMIPLKNRPKQIETDKISEPHPLSDIITSFHDTESFHFDHSPYPENEELQHDREAITQRLKDTIDLPLPQNRPRLNQHIFSYLNLSANASPILISDEPLYRSVYEYRAMGKLIRYVFLYMLIWYLIGVLIIDMTVIFSPYLRNLLSEEKTSPFFFSLFAAISCFNNCGMSVLENGFGDVIAYPTISLTLGFLIIAGNTLFPLFLRFFVNFFKSQSKSQRPIYHFIMRKSRLCYTHLFDSVQTRLLALFWLFLFLLNFIFICALDWNKLHSAVPADSSFRGKWFSILCTAFACAVNVRTCGSSMAPERSFNNSTLWTFIIAMFFGPYPFILALQRSRQEVDYDEEKRRSQDTANQQEEGDLVLPPAYLFSDGNDVTFNEHMSINSEIPRAASDSGFSVNSYQRVRRERPMIRMRKRRSGKLKWKIALRQVTQFLVSQQDNPQIRDIVVLFIFLVLITMIENKKIVNGQMSNMQILFDLVSAYGNVGLSLGFGTITSKRHPMHVASEVLMIIVMFRGKHREIPSDLDHAIDFKHFLDIPVPFEHVIHSLDQIGMVLASRHSKNPFKSTKKPPAHAPPPLSAFPSQPRRTHSYSGPSTRQRSINGHFFSTPEEEEGVNERTGLLNSDMMTDT